MSATYTRTFSAARVEVYAWTSTAARSIGERILDDLILMVGRGLLSQDTALSWFSDLAFLLESAATERIEVQLTPPSGLRAAVRYDLVHAGLMRNSDAGGLNLYPFPEGTRVNLLVSYRLDHPRLVEVRAEMARRGWTSGGSFVEGGSTQDRSYSHNGVGVNRSLIGGW